MENQDDGRPFLCKHCQNRYTRKDSLWDHLKTKHNFYAIISCKLCDEQFQTYLDHSNHMTFDHLKSAKSNCKRCGKHFTSIKTKNVHEKTIQCTKN